MNSYDKIVLGALDIASSKAMELKNTEMFPAHLLYGLILNKGSFSSRSLKSHLVEVEGLLETIYGKISPDDLQQNSYSQEALYVADTYEKLPPKFKKSIATESFKVIGFLDALNPAIAQTLEVNRQVMKRIIN